MFRKTNQSGRTSSQLKAAPQNAVYIWPCNASLFYPKELAKTLNRTDITFAIASTKPEKFFGIRNQIVIDHAAFNLLSPELHYFIREHNQKCQSSAPSSKNSFAPATFTSPA